MGSLKLTERGALTEGWNDPRLSLLERKYIVPFVASIELYVTEAKLTPDQIQQLFTGAEQGMTAGGKNRTFLGKGVDAAKLPIEAVKFINDQINKLGRALQNSGPVKNIDAKFDQLKAKIGASDSKVVQGIQAVSDWAKANPGKASLAVGILTAAASMAGGPMGGAIAGFLSRATKDLLQGEKLSTAVGKSIKTAALGALTGKAFEMVGDWLGGLRADVVMKDQFADVSWDATKTISAPGMEWTQSIKGVNIKVLPDDAEVINGLMKTLGGSDPEQRLQAFDKLYALAKEIRSPDYKQLLSDVGEMAKNNDSLYQWIQGAKTALQSIGQGAVQASGNNKQAPAKAESKKFTALQVETIIEWCDGTPQVLTEGPLDALKKGAAAVGSAIKKGAGAVAKAGKNLTTKVTADKLNKAWVKAGSPDDSDKIADIMRNAGVSDEVLAPIYKQMGATLPAAPKPAAEPAATPTTPGSEPAAPSQATAPAGQSSAQPAQGSAQSAPGQMDFKGIQQAVAKLNPAQAKELVTHIDSLDKNPAASTATSQPAAQGTAQSSTKPAAGAAPTASSKAAPAADKNAAAGDTYEKAKANIRNVQSGAKPLPANIAQGIQADLAKMAKGDKESGVFAADKIMKLARLGMDVKDIQAKWLANSKAGERFLTQSQYFEITKMLREHGLRWSDLGLRIHLIEGTNAYFGISKV